MAEPRAPPPGVVSVADVLDGEAGVGKLVNIVGLVKDCRAPVPTRGKDFKMEVTIYDMSTQEDGRGVTLSIFRPANEMEDFSAGDVVVAFSVKVQEWSGNLSLISSRTTAIHIYESGAIPRLPNSAASALKPRKKLGGKPPGQKEHEYVSYIYYNIDKSHLPDTEHFEAVVVQSRNVRDKFSTLGSVTDGKFHDLIVQVVREPYDAADKVTLWVSDFTKNPAFFNHQGSGNISDGDDDGDPYGYTSKFGARKQQVSDDAWSGPVGQLSLQVTCYDPHAGFILEAVKIGTWVRLRNVQIKSGRNGMNLEGYLREDQTYPQRINVELLYPRQDPGNERLQAAARREAEHTKNRKPQIRPSKAPSSTPAEAQRRSKAKFSTPAAAEASATDELAAAPSAKRKAAEPEQPAFVNAKKRRQKERAAKQKAKEKEEAQKKEEALGLNIRVRCENLERETVPLSRLRESTVCEWRAHGTDQTIRKEAPFENDLYRANVRVVNFHPPRLEDFTAPAPRKRQGYGTPSEASDYESDDDGGVSGGWEWLFALELEDANASSKSVPPTREWVIVKNQSAQLLTMLDAADLRRDRATLEKLRERMFTLWGNLEEINASCTESIETTHAENKRRLKAGLPPASSDVPPPTPAGKQPDQKLSNRPFSCCIRQHGRKFRALRPEDADMGDGVQLERVFELFGTKILL